MIEKVADTDATVLVRGESGTGKELVARELHERSTTRSSGAFVAVNCAALPTELIESELFGHEKGAFTGAAARRKGKFEQANGGTLFLDEIGDMSANVQAKLLRALEDRRIERLGGDESIPVDVRIISATHRVLEEEIIPLFYDRDGEEIPRRWVTMMKHAIQTLLPRFSSDRMVADYVERIY